MTLYEDVTAGLRAFYDSEAEARDGAVKQRFKLDERAAFLDRLQAVRAVSLLEIAAGTGQDSVFFADAGLDVVAVDLSPEMVRRCKDKGIEAYVRDVRHLQFPPGSFDAVYAMNCLVHVPDAELPEALREIREVLRPGGLCFLGQWGEARDDDVHFSARGDEQMFAAVRDLFEVVDFHTLEDEGRHFQSVTAVRPLP
jgi:SAM-dependent methyltransferase